MCGPGSSVGIATDYGLDGPGLNPGGDEIFPPVQTGPGAHPASCKIGIARSKRDGTREETRFGLSAKRTSPFKSAGVSVQSTAGSRRVRISGQRLYRPCSDVQCKAAGYSLHSHVSPSLPLPCVTVCHQVPNVLYKSVEVGRSLWYPEDIDRTSSNPKRR